MRDEEQQELAFEAQRAAVELIEGQRDKLEQLALALLEHEVLERDDIDRIMAGVPRMERRPGIAGLRMVAASANEDEDSDPSTNGSAPARRTSKPPPVPGV
jgi:cell division protease FtsH